MGFGFMAFVFFVVITRWTVLEYDSELQSHECEITECMLHYIYVYRCMSFWMKCDVSGLLSSTLLGFI